MPSWGASKGDTIDLAPTRALLHELPDALRPAWGARTWSGTFGERGLEAVVRSIDSVVTIGGEGVTGSAKVRGVVLAGEHGPPGVLGRLRQLLHGGEARTGRFAHELVLHPEGRLEAHHSLLHLSRGARGTGFGGGFVDHARAAYAAAGVDEATMFAGQSVGGYAWARMGLDLPTSATSEPARSIERGRRIAALVDASRGWVDLSGVVPRIGRRITAAEHAVLEPRLVRGDTLVPDAITTMSQLAAEPELGRKVLLGHVWRGVAQIDRTAPWWQRNGAHAAEQLAAGASWHTAPDVVGAESVRAARRIGAALPAASDPFRAAEVFERHLATVGGGSSAPATDAARGARAIVHASLDEQATHVRTTVPMHTAAGRRLELGVEWDGTRLVGRELVPLLESRSTGLRQALDAAWRELGVTQVRSGRTGLARSISNVPG